MSDCELSDYARLMQSARNMEARLHVRSIAQRLEPDGWPIGGGSVWIIPEPMRIWEDPDTPIFNQLAWSRWPYIGIPFLESPPRHTAEDATHRSPRFM